VRGATLPELLRERGFSKKKDEMGKGEEWQVLIYLNIF